MVEKIKNQKTLIFSTVFILIVVICVWKYTSTRTSPLINANTNALYVATTTDRYLEYVGVISEENGHNVYTSSKYHLSFPYPSKWIIGDNHLGYGTLQIESPDSGGGADYTAAGNKIEATIIFTGDPHTYFDSTNAPKGYATTTESIISGRSVMQTDVNMLPAAVFRSYLVPIVNMKGTYLQITIYGHDTSNFKVLDNIVKSLSMTE